MTELARPDRGSARLTAWLAFVLLFAALAYYSRFAADERPGDDVFYTWPFFAAALVQLAVNLAVLLLISIGASKRDLFALRRPASWGRALLGGLGVYAAVFAVSIVVSQFVDPQEEQGLVPDFWDASRAAPFFANAVVVSTLVPVAEELTFRGAGYSLLARFGTREAIVVVGILFGLAHGLVESLPLLAAFGIGLAWLRSWTRSLYPCILLHAVFNAAALTLGVTLGGEE